MALVVTASNYLVQFPINEWLTWGAFTYPFAFLVTDLTNRGFGPKAARLVIGAGFIVALALSLGVVADEAWRIPVASLGAFLVGQLLDVSLFNRLRQASWWKAPLISSVVASIVDTAIFFAGAFAGMGIDWLSLAAGDLAVKLAMALLLLTPFRLLMGQIRPAPAI